MKKNRNMHADIQGALAQINKSWKAFTHKGNPMTKEQVTKVLIYANNKGYKSTSELSDEEIDKILEKETYKEYKSRKGITDEYIESIELAKDSVTIVSELFCKHCDNKLCDSQKFNQQCFKCGKKPQL